MAKIKHPLFADAMLSMSKIPSNLPRKILPELINVFSKFAGDKIDTQKWITFLYADNEQMETKIKNAIPLLQRK